MFTSYPPEASETADQTLLPLTESLIAIAQDHHRHHTAPVPIIAIGGCPGVGKSFLTKTLLTILQSSGVTCASLAIDDFLLSSEDRANIGTEWDLRHLKVAQLHDVLSSINAGGLKSRSTTAIQAKLAKSFWI